MTQTQVWELGNYEIKKELLEVKIVKGKLYVFRQNGKEEVFGQGQVGTLYKEDRITVTERNGTEAEILNES